MSKKKGINILKKNEIIDEFLQILPSYSSEVINSRPDSEQALHKMYEDYTDPIISFAKNLTSDNIFFLSNEVRAMFGHIAEYRLDGGKKNLEDAYGHFRRLNIDMFKVLCNEFDKTFLKYLKKHYHYDFRDVHSSFLKDYAQLYFDAKNTYLEAQLKEHVGSDRLSGNVIELYYNATVKYSELLEYFRENHKGIEKQKISFIVSVVCSTIFSIIGLFV